LETTANPNFWIVGINLVIWTGLFLYLLRLGKRLREMEKEP
jgi:CcmD family protein